jgi:hypothetical protein
MNRTGGGPFTQDPIAGALGDPAKRALAAQILGQSYVVAHNLVTRNQEAVDKIADTLVARQEIFGDDLIDLLDSVGLRIPELDFGDENSWPSPFFAIAGGRQKPRLPEANAT